MRDLVITTTIGLAMAIVVVLDIPNRYRQRHARQVSVISKDGQMESDEQQPGYVWAVVYSNYEPPEVASLHATRTLAEQRVDELGTGWHVQRWVVEGWQ